MGLVLVHVHHTVSSYVEFAHFEVIIYLWAGSLAGLPSVYDGRELEPEVSSQIGDTGGKCALIPHGSGPVVAFSLPLNSVIVLSHLSHPTSLHNTVLLFQFLKIK